MGLQNVTMGTGLERGIMKNGRGQVLILGCVVALVFYPTFFGLSVALAEQFRIVTEKKDPVCELCKQNLETLHPGSVRCGREYAPQFSSLKPVEWTTLDVLSHKDLVKKIGRFAYSGDQETGKTSWGSTDAEFEEALADELRRRDLGLSTTEVDIDNDGQSEVVLRCEIGECPFSSQQLYVLTADRSALDIQKTRPLLSCAWGMSVGVFDYKGGIYVDVWDDLEERLNIHKYVVGKEQDICVLKYRKNPKASKSGR